MTRPDWPRYTRKNPCPICGKDRCCYAPDRNAVWCWRDGGRFHDLDGKPQEVNHKLAAPKPKPNRNWEVMHRMLMDAMTDDVAAHMADLFGVPEATLVLFMGMGYDAEHQRVTFPMRNGHSDLVGLRTRYLDTGAKRAVSGSAGGLFLPARPSSETDLWVCEGESDTACLHSMGLWAIGRSSNTSCVNMTCDYIVKHTPGRVFLVKDNDEPGTSAHTATERGVRKLAGAIREAGAWVAIVAPPHQIKDVKDWKKAGADRDEVVGWAVNCSEVIR